MNRFASFMGFVWFASVVTLTACPPSCKQDATIAAQATADCGGNVFTNIIDGIHQGAAGIITDIMNAVADGFCFEKAIKLHIAEAHGCAGNDGSCNAAMSAAESKLLDQALTIAKGLQARKASAP